MSVIDKMKNNKLIKDSVLKENTELSFINTGCCSLNVLFSGKLNGGIPIGKISQIAAPSALGKTFIGLKIASNAQKLGMEVLMLDTEFAFDHNFSESVGVKSDKLLVVQDNHIESVQQKILTLVEDLTVDERKNLLIIIDSYGGLVTSKTVDDATSGADKVDLSGSRKKNTFARLLMSLGCTVFVVNTVYDTFDTYNPITPGGGRGIFYASHCLVMATSKARDKEGDEISGAIITAKVLKSRLAIEHSKLKFVIKHDGGIHPVLGIEDDLLEMEWLLKPSNGWYQRNYAKLGIEGEDKKWRMKEIQDNWQEFYKPILTNKEVQFDFEKAYSFKHHTIVQEDIFEI